jgi:hypothetical protein
MMTHELLPWEQILSFLKRRTTLNRQKLLDTLKGEAIKREAQAASIRKAMKQIETESWEQENR